MVITPFENGGLRLQVSDLSLLVDPPAGGRGDVILRTRAGLPLVQNDDIKTPGEYEIRGLRITGFNLAAESNDKELANAFAVTFDEINLGFLGGLKTDLPENILDRLLETDILFLPAGAPYLDAKKAISLVKRIEPSIVVFLPAADPKALSNELGQKPETLDKLSVKKKDLGEHPRYLVFEK